MNIFNSINGTVCNAEQYSQSQFGYGGYGTPPIFCLTHGQSIGLALIAEVSLISCISIIVIFIRIGWNIRWYRKTFPKGDWKLFERPADIYMFSLFVFDLLQAIGGIFNTRWAHRGIVTTGHYCTAQGVIDQIGEVGVALISVLLAVHTFVAALWQVGLQARGVALGMDCIVCVFITLCIAIGAGIHKYYDTPTPYWCSINPQFLGMYLGGIYIWLWTALFASAILYIPLYFWAEGRLSVDKVSWYKFHMSGPDQRAGYAQRRAALGMLLYPIASFLVLLPIFIPRWLIYCNHNVSSAVVFFGATMFNLSGAIDVLLFLIARPHLLLFPRPERLAEPDIELVPQELISAAPLVDEGSRNGAAQSRVNSSRLSDDI